MTFEVAYNFQAKITLFATQSGWRKKSIFSGYKPSFVFNSQKQYCGEIKLLDKEELRPGETSLARIKLLPARTISGNIHINTAFTLVEGNKEIGRGVIVKEISKKETTV